jgi:hypothetical protein
VQWHEPNHNICTSEELQNFTVKLTNVFVCGVCLFRCGLVGWLVFVLEGVVGLLVVLVFYEDAKALLVRCPHWQVAVRKIAEFTILFGIY